MKYMSIVLFLLFTALGVLLWPYPDGGLFLRHMGGQILAPLAPQSYRLAKINYSVYPGLWRTVYQIQVDFVDQRVGGEPMTPADAALYGEANFIAAMRQNWDSDAVLTPSEQEVLSAMVRRAIILGEPIATQTVENQTWPRRVWSRGVVLLFIWASGLSIFWALRRSRHAGA